MVAADHSRKSGIALEKTYQFLFRLAMDLRYLDLERYEFAVRAIDEIGRPVGGWTKTRRAALIPVVGGSAS